MLWPLVTVLGFAGSPAPAACPASLQDWSVAQGSLTATARCGALVVSTDARRMPFSYALVTRREPVALPYELSLTWRRLTPDDRSMELQVLGGMLLFKDHRLGLWITDDQFAIDGWQAVPGYDAHAATAITVTQDARGVEVALGGAVVARWALTPPLRVGLISAALKGAPGARASLELSDVSVRSLDTPPPPRR